MILGICIVGIMISVLGMVKKIRGALITLIMWILSALSLLLGLSSLRGSLYTIILSLILFAVQMVWIIKINKLLKEE